MSEEDRIIQDLRSAAADASRRSPATDVAWQQIQRRAARRNRRHWLGRLAAVLAPLFAAGGIAGGAIEAYAPASRPQQVVVPPSPSSTVVVTTTLPVRTTSPATTTVPVATTQPRAASRARSTTTTVAPSTTTSPPATTSAVPLTSVPWASITYPFSCGTTLQGRVGYRVAQVAYPQPVPGRKVALVMVECNSGAGTPPVELLVYNEATSRLTPHLAQTLIAVSSRDRASAFTVRGTNLSAAVNGFSSQSVPNCCPDIHTTLTWHWAGSGYQSGP